MAPDDLVARVLRAADYYAVLGVDRRASLGEIERAHKKRMRALHPDKNKTPGAEEAFKMVGEAYATLSDPEKRTRYDQQVAPAPAPAPVYYRSLAASPVESEAAYRSMAARTSQPMPAAEGLSRGGRGYGWREHEDAKLVEAVRTQGTHWEEIAKLIPGRTADAVRERWHRLKQRGTAQEPPAGERHDERKYWTAEEDALIVEGYRKHGGQWRLIAASLPAGRSGSSTRNRWKRLRGGAPAAAAVRGAPAAAAVRGAPAAAAAAPVAGMQVEDVDEPELAAAPPPPLQQQPPPPPPAAAARPRTAADVSDDDGASEAKATVKQEPLGDGCGSSAPRTVESSRRRAAELPASAPASAGADASAAATKEVRVLDITDESVSAEGTHYLTHFANGEEKQWVHEDAFVDEDGKECEALKRWKRSKANGTLTGDAAEEALEEAVEDGGGEVSDDEEPPQPPPPPPPPAAAAPAAAPKPKAPNFFYRPDNATPTVMVTPAEKMDDRQLRAELQKRGLSPSGLRPSLLERVRSARAAAAAAADDVRAAEAAPPPAAAEAAPVAVSAEEAQQRQQEEMVQGTEARRSEMAVTDEEWLAGKKRALEEVKAAEAEVTAKRVRLEAEVKEAEAADARVNAAALEAEKTAKRQKLQDAETLTKLRAVKAAQEAEAEATAKRARLAEEEKRARLALKAAAAAAQAKAAEAAAAAKEAETARTTTAATRAAARSAADAKALADAEKARADAKLRAARDERAKIDRE